LYFIDFLRGSSVPLAFHSLKFFFNIKYFLKTGFTLLSVHTTFIVIPTLLIIFTFYWWTWTTEFFTHSYGKQSGHVTCILNMKMIEFPILAVTAGRVNSCSDLLIVRIQTMHIKTVTIERWWHLTSWVNARSGWVVLLISCTYSELGMHSNRISACLAGHCCNLFYSASNNTVLRVWTNFLWLSELEPCVFHKSTKSVGS
jgi:hypothetical protein